MLKENDQIEIDLFDLLKTIAYRWRLVLSIMLITMLVSIPVCVGKNIRNNAQASTQVQQEVSPEQVAPSRLSWDDIDSSQLSQKEKQYVDNTVRLYQLWDAQKKNQEDVDYDKLKSGLVQYQIKSSNMTFSSTDDVHAFANAIADYVNGGGLEDDLLDYPETEFNKNRIESTLSCKLNTSTQSLTPGQGSEVLFSVYCCANPDEINELVTAIETCISDYVSSLQGYENCSMLVANDEVSDYVEKNALANKLSTQQSLNSQFDSISNYCADFTNEQRKYFNECVGTQYLELLTEDTAANTVDSSDTESDTATEAVTIIPLTHNLLRSMFLGMVLGFVIASMLISVQYVMSGTVKCDNFYSDHYDLYQIGCLQKAPVRTGRGASVDKLLDSIFRKNEISIEQKSQLVVSKIRTLIKNEKIHNIYLCSSGNTNEKYIEEVSQLLKQNEINVETNTALITNSNAFERAVENGNIVFVEKICESKIEEFSKALNICKENKIKVLGIISI